MYQRSKGSGSPSQENDRFDMNHPTLQVQTALDCRSTKVRSDRVVYDRGGAPNTRLAGNPANSKRLLGEEFPDLVHPGPCPRTVPLAVLLADCLEFA